MRLNRIASCFLAALFSIFPLLDRHLASGMQSLEDIARMEGERRRLLEQQGIEGKVIEGYPEYLAPNGNVTTSTPMSAVSPKTEGAPPSHKNEPSVRSLRTKLQKLDRDIKKEEERLKLLRERLRAGRWALPKVGRVSATSQNEESQARLQNQIEDLEIKLKYLRQERADSYEEGRKAGFLPGELEGKGIIP